MSMLVLKCKVLKLINRTRNVESIKILEYKWMGDKNAISFDVYN